MVNGSSSFIESTRFCFLGEIEAEELGGGFCAVTQPNGTRIAEMSQLGAYFAEVYKQTQRNLSI